MYILTGNISDSKRDIMQTQHILKRTLYNYEKYIINTLNNSNTMPLQCVLHSSKTNFLAHRIATVTLQNHFEPKTQISRIKFLGTNSQKFS